MICSSKDRGILGNGHFMMIENNRRQVFDAIADGSKRSWARDAARLLTSQLRLEIRASPPSSKSCAPIPEICGTQSHPV